MAVEGHVYGSLGIRMAVDGYILLYVEGYI